MSNPLLFCLFFRQFRVVQHVAEQHEIIAAASDQVVHPCHGYLRFTRHRQMAFCVVDQALGSGTRRPIAPLYADCVAQFDSSWFGHTCMVSHTYRVRGAPPIHIGSAGHRRGGARPEVGSRADRGQTKLSRSTLMGAGISCTDGLCTDGALRDMKRQTDPTSVLPCGVRPPFQAVLRDGNNMRARSFRILSSRLRSLS